MISKKLWRCCWVLVVVAMAMGSSALGENIGLWKQDVLVRFAPNVLSASTTEMASIADVNIASPKLRSLMADLNVQGIEKVFKNFEHKDTIGISQLGERVRLNDLTDIYRLRLSREADVPLCIIQLLNLPEVMYAERNGTIEPLVTHPNDPYFHSYTGGDDQWGLYNTGQHGGTAGADIHATSAWDITRGNSSTILGILDGGVDKTHADLTGKVSGDQGVAWDGHGTHVAGIAGAQTNNNLGVAGVCWECQLYSENVAGFVDNADYPSIVSKINDAVNHRASVLNMSWRLPGGPSETVRLGIENALFLGAIPVVAMGNNDGNTTQYPAGYKYMVIAVGATDRNDIVANLSDYGAHIKLVAPGIAIVSTLPNNQYGDHDGTSMAAPFVTGSVGLLLSLNNNLRDVDAEHILELSADFVPGQTGWNQNAGWGRLNVYRALQYISSPYVVERYVGGNPQRGAMVSKTQQFINPGVSWLQNLHVYDVDRYEVNVSVTFSPQFTQTPWTWTRVGGTNGRSAENPLGQSTGYCYNWAQIIANSATGATFRTYVYWIKHDNTGNHDVFQWYPCSPEQVTIANTEVGIPVPVPSTPTLSASSFSKCSFTGINPEYQPGIGWNDPQPGIYNWYEIRRQRKNESWADRWVPSDPTFQEVDDCQPSNLFPISYQIKAFSSGGQSDWSDVLTFNYPPQGDPIISPSQDSFATAFPNGQKVVLDRKDRLNVVFASGDTVYYTSSNKKAKKWSGPVAVGVGKFPAIAMDSHDSPYVLWTSGTQVLSAQLSNGVWTTPYSLFSSSGATIEAPSFVMNTANDSGFASWTVVTTTSSEVSLASFMPGDTTAPVSIQRVDSAGSTSFASPSLALDPTGKVLVSWSRDGEVYFQERGGSILNLSQSPGNLSIHPVVDAYGDRVSVIYQEQDSTGAFKIKRVVKEDGTWGAAQDLNLFTGNALFPAVAGASQVAFSSDVAGRREIYYQGMYEDGGFINATTLSASSEGAAHNYPSVALDNDWPNATLNCIWTDEIVLGVPPRAIKTIAMVVPLVPSVFVDAGKGTPSSHTVQRAGTVTYGSQPYLTADTHPQKLIYRFSGLNPNKRYRLGVTYYFEKPGETWRMRLVVDGRDGMRTRILSGERVDDSNWVPASVYQDGVIDVEITPDAGDFALCNEIALYEFARGSGGPQTDETGPIEALPLTYALGQSFPNPFKDNATISYQLPEETPVSLKVFNVTGQVVRELASGKQKAGFYNAVWDGKDSSGRSVSSGVYFYRLDAASFSKTNKLVVVR
jgi:hypothetical protein